MVFQDSDQAQSSSRICGTIDAVLDTEDIKELQKHNVWQAQILSFFGPTQHGVS